MTAFFRKHTLILKNGPEDTYIGDDVAEGNALGPLEDIHIDDDVGKGNTLGPENERGPGSPVAPRTPGNKIRPRSRYFGSASKARYNKATSITVKGTRKDAIGIPRHEAARSVIGQQAIVRSVTERAAGRGRTVPISNIFARFLQATPGRVAAQSVEVAPVRPTGSSAPKTSYQAAVQDVQNLQSEPPSPIRETVPSVVTSFGREAARSVFVANPN
ncbi:hypothetical protein C7999DRAFT_18582 [Corynascus novoguineensis]|uniref:Uncharacterized protein n=1 Tax=Corynascus novoguineensis TaxID=1126955 RepID=A0AAN7HAU1_9PEZI|nr:hypothetical protein C7999DRAFT_18582 [Corynascus novoguineensis]